MAVISTSWERQLVAGHPVLDFVNTLDNRFVNMRQTNVWPPTRIFLSSYRPAICSLHSSPARSEHLPTHPQDRPHCAAYGCCASNSQPFLPPVGRGPGAASLAALQVEFSRAKRHLSLRWQHSGHSGGHAYWDWPSNPTSDWPLWILARQAELLIVSDEAAVRSCAQASCRWLFLDTSRNQSRRWCDMKLCGNRAKARRFQARHSG